MTSVKQKSKLLLRKWQKTVSEFWLSLLDLHVLANRLPTAHAQVVPRPPITLHLNPSTLASLLPASSECLILPVPVSLAAFVA
jgi:hypothetical protein